MHFNFFREKLKQKKRMAKLSKLEANKKEGKYKSVVDCIDHVHKNVEI